MEEKGLPVLPFIGVEEHGRRRSCAVNGGGNGAAVGDSGVDVRGEGGNGRNGRGVSGRFECARPREGRGRDSRH